MHTTSLGNTLFKGATVLKNFLRCSSTLNKDIALNPNFHNRNPRNLENMNVLKKDIGWGTKQDKNYGMNMDKEAVNIPQRNYYNTLKVTTKARGMVVEVEHMDGKVILKADTSEWWIKKQLYRETGIATYMNMAHVIAERCFRNGIEAVHWGMPDQITKDSESLLAFKNALIETGLKIEEPPVRKVEYKIKRQPQTYEKFL